MMAQLAIRGAKGITHGKARIGLTYQENEIIWLLMLGKQVSREDIIDALWPNPDNQPDGCMRQVDVLMCAVRRKLRSAGWNIPHAKYGWGWTLEKA